MSFGSSWLWAEFPCSSCSLCPNQNRSSQDRCQGNVNGCRLLTLLWSAARQGPPCLWIYEYIQILPVDESFTKHITEISRWTQLQGSLQSRVSPIWLMCKHQVQFNLVGQTEDGCYSSDFISRFPLRPQVSSYTAASSVLILLLPLAGWSPQAWFGEGAVGSFLLAVYSQIHGDTKP